MQSARFTARLAPYVDAIQSARSAGVTWKQLGDLFGVKHRTMAAAYKVATSGKYSALEQLPLPEPEKLASSKVSSRPASTARVQSKLSTNDDDEPDDVLSRIQHL